MLENIPGSVTKSEMAQTYEVLLKTFSSWLKTAGISFKGSYYLPSKIVKKITDEFGVPKKWVH